LPILLAIAVGALFQPTAPLPYTDTQRHLNEGAVCIGSTLAPSETLYANQFLCRGQQRFGIYNGRLVLGLTATDSSDSSSNNVEPTQIAWAALPTTLFIECSHPFHSLYLSPNGNLLGYDSSNLIIYDSNLDYGNRFEGKISDSILGFVSCSTTGMCLRLMSPAWPGRPWGVATWGVELDADAMVDVEDIVYDNDNIDDDDESGSFSLSFVDNISSDSINNTTTNYNVNGTLFPSKQPSASSTPTYLPTLSPNIPSQSIIYGSVWLDYDANGRMDVGEKPIAGVTVQMFACDVNSTLVDTKITDSKGWYFFQVPHGREYKAYFDLQLQEVHKYQFTSGEDTHTIDGWTECASPTLENSIQWNAGLHNKNSNVAGKDRPISSSQQPIIANSQIGGAIFIDLNGNGIMDTVESNAVEKGYTVTDAQIHISIHDCEANLMKQSIEIPFPSTYRFANLTEGLYKIEFDIVSLNNNKQTKESREPLYSFDDGTSSLETNCINLRRNDVNDNVHAGIRIPKLKVNTKVSEDLLGQMEQSYEEEKEVTIQTAEVVEKKPVVGWVMGCLAVLMGVVSLLVYNSRRRGGDKENAVVDVPDDLDLKEAVDVADDLKEVVIVNTKDDSSSDHPQDEISSQNPSNQGEIITSDAIQLDNHFQRNPYHSTTSSIFETESLDSDPYIYTGDEQEESLGSDPSIHIRDENKFQWEQEYSSNTATFAQSPLEYTLRPAFDYDKFHSNEESSVISNRSSDPPAASYRDIPSTSHAFHHSICRAQNVYNYSSNHTSTMYQCTEEYTHHPPSYNVPPTTHIDFKSAEHHQSDYPFESDESSSSYEESESSSSSSSANNLECSQVMSGPLPYQPHTGWHPEDAIANTHPRERVLPHSSHCIEPIIDESSSVISAKSDHSSDPPGASYQVLSSATGHWPYRGQQNYRQSYPSSHR
jgi:hypothetical protein